jgi:hypothetical protein
MSSGATNDIPLSGVRDGKILTCHPAPIDQSQGAPWQLANFQFHETSSSRQHLTRGNGPRTRKPGASGSPFDISSHCARLHFAQIMLGGAWSHVSFRFPELMNQNHHRRWVIVLAVLALAAMLLLLRAFRSPDQSIPKVSLSMGNRILGVATVRLFLGNRLAAFHLKGRCTPYPSSGNSLTNPVGPSALHAATRPTIGV